VTVRHFTILRAGFLSSLPYFVFGASEPLGGWIADRLTAHGWDQTRTWKGIVTVAFLTGLLLIPASRVQNANTAIWLLAGASLVGLATGNLGGVLAPLITGVLISRTGSYAPGFMLATIVLLGGIVCYWFIVGKLDSGG
jgi:ACS family D-galactonate transporter-like MFS transporter